MLSDSIVAYLDHEKYLCEQAFTYTETIEKVRLYAYDCVLLDLMLPGGNGLDILRDNRRLCHPYSTRQRHTRVQTAQCGIDQTDDREQGQLLHTKRVYRERFP